MADSATLLSLSDHIHLVLIKTDPSGDTTLVGSHFLTWRDILSSANGRMACSVEINGVGAEAKVPMGILDIKFEIIPRLSQVKVHSSIGYIGQGSKKVWSSRPRRVESLSGQVTFHSHLPNG